MEVLPERVYHNMYVPDQREPLYEASKYHRWSDDFASRRKQLIDGLPELGKPSSMCPISAVLDLGHHLRAG